MSNDQKSPDWTNRPAYLRQIAEELDHGAETVPCSEAMICEAAAEIEDSRKAICVWSQTVAEGINALTESQAETDQLLAIIKELVAVFHPFCPADYKDGQAALQSAAAAMVNPTDAERLARRLDPEAWAMEPPDLSASQMRSVWCGGSRADQERISYYTEKSDPLCQSCWEKEYNDGESDAR
jgi:hypothetical protein